MKSPLSRRTLLRGAGGVAIALPFLDAMAPRRASAAPAIKRLFLMHNQNGVVPSAWFPTGTEKDFKLAAAMMPLEPHKSSLIVLDGIDKQQNKDNGTAHARGMASTFTGNTSKDGFADGPSVEQPIANAISAGTKIKYLLAGKVSNYHVFHSGPRMIIPPVDDPKANFDRMFTGFTPPASVGGMPGTSPDVDKLRARKKSILDHALEEYKRVSATVGPGDRKRLDVHAETIRQIERGLDASGSTPAAAGAACKKPDAPPVDGGYAERGKANMELLCLALACDMTRVVGMQWTSHGTAFSWLGVTTLHHPLAHQTGNAGADAQLIKILTWHAQQAADAITRLKSYQEGEGTVFDNTLFLWGNEISTGSHQFPRAPYLMATGKLLQGGRYLKYGGLPHPTVLVSAANVMGLPMTSFGNGGWQKGALPGL